MDPKKPDEQSPETEFEAVFRQWEDRRGVAPPPGLVTDDVPLTDEELALDHEVAKTPEAILARARRAARSRLIFAILLSTVAALTLWFNRGDFAYFLLDAGDVVELGDLRERWRAGERPDGDGFGTLQSNTWVRFENAIMTEEREGGSGSFFFYEPILSAVVVTRRALPDKHMRTIALHASFAELIGGRWIHPHDLSAAFSGEGRLLEASEAPRRYRSILKRYRAWLHLDRRLGDRPLWLILDGVKPPDQAVWVGIYVVALLVILLSLFFYWRARQRLVLLEESLQLTAESDQRAEQS